MTDRIKKVVKYLIGNGLAENQGAIGAVLGYKNKSSFSQIINGKVPINDDFIKRLSSLAPEINNEWLLKGQGPMLNSVEIVKPDVSKKEISKLTNYKPSKFEELIPTYEVDFIAGTAFDSVETQQVTPSYYMDIPDFRGCTAFRAYSDSMEGRIKSGSILFGTKVERWNEHLEYGQIYGIVCEDGRKYLKYIKRYRENPREYFLLESENKAYDEFEMPKNAIRSIWLIHGHLSKRI